MLRRHSSSSLINNNNSTKHTDLNEKEVEFFFAALSVASSSSSPTSSASSSTTDPVLQILKKRQLQDSLDKFRMASTNLSTSDEELQQSKAKLLEALEANGILEKTLSQYNNRMEFLNGEAERKASGKTSYKDKNCYTQTKMQQVVKNLFVSSWHAATDAPLLQNAGITHICQCIDVKPRLENQGFKYFCIPAEDNDSYKIDKFFDASFDFIDEAISREGTGVIVFCGAGISRSVTICAAYLIKKMKIGADDAVGMIQKVRRVARPNNGFMQQLREYAKKIPN